MLPIQFSMIVRRSEPAFKLDFHRAFKILKRLLEYLESQMNLKVGGLKWTRTTDLALIRRAL